MFDGVPRFVADPAEAVSVVAPAVDYARSGACFSCGRPVLHCVYTLTHRREDGIATGTDAGVSWSCACGAGVVTAVKVREGSGCPGEVAA